LRKTWWRERKLNNKIIFLHFYAKHKIQSILRLLCMKMWIVFQGSFAWIKNGLKVEVGRARA
jgi:hypothetical protein